MAANPIYVETEEEIPEVVERLRRVSGEETMVVLPTRSRIGQSRFNLQLLRNYASRLGKRVTVVCDDPAVQKMASESGFAVFGAVSAEGEGVPSEPPPPPPIRHWWSRARETQQAARIAVGAQSKLISKSATALKPGRFLLYVSAAMVMLFGLFAFAVYVPSASVTLIAQAQPFSQRDVEIQAEPGKPPIRVRGNVISRSNSQGFKATGLSVVNAAQAYGKVKYTNNLSKPRLDPSPGLSFPYGQRLLNTDGITFAQTSPATLVTWGGGTAMVDVIAIKPGIAGNVGSDTITTIVDCCGPYDPTKVLANNPQATGGGVDASSQPLMTQGDFDDARAQLEQGLRQSIAQELAGAGQPGEKLSETIVYGAPDFNTDHRPGDNVPNFSGTMTLQGEGDFYIDSDVQKAYAAYLAQRVPSDQQLLVESGVKVDYRVLNANYG